MSNGLREWHLWFFHKLQLRQTSIWRQICTTTDLHWFERLMLETILTQHFSCSTYGVKGEAGEIRDLTKPSCWRKYLLHCFEILYTSRFFKTLWEHSVVMLKTVPWNSVTVCALGSLTASARNTAPNKGIVKFLFSSAPNRYFYLRPLTFVTVCVRLKLRQGLWVGVWTMCVNVQVCLFKKLWVSVAVWTIITQTLLALRVNCDLAKRVRLLNSSQRGQEDIIWNALDRGYVPIWPRDWFLCFATL